MKSTSQKNKGAKGSRKKKSTGLAAPEAAAIRNKYLRAYSENVEEESQTPVDQIKTNPSPTTEAEPNPIVKEKMIAASSADTVRSKSRTGK